MGNASVQDPNRRVASVDEQAWVKERVNMAIRMGIALRRLADTGGHPAEVVMAKGIDGVVNGTAAEILDTLNLRPAEGYVNL